MQVMGALFFVGVLSACMVGMWRIVDQAEQGVRAAERAERHYWLVEGLLAEGARRYQYNQVLQARLRQEGVAQEVVQIEGRFLQGMFSAEREYRLQQGGSISLRIVLKNKQNVAVCAGQGQIALSGVQ